MHHIYRTERFFVLIHELSIVCCVVMYMAMHDKILYIYNGWRTVWESIVKIYQINCILENMVHSFDTTLFQNTLVIYA